ncbi:calponin [Podospora bellae-mahoneyi]|uniref:Calponin n=1 Tax=Podospora bellae-mahoneyi TaxID=2093777 RepID=A0ABR0F7K4_9PEZI|nr:calponin [Podospora bellae-mahoneyi]
MASVTSLDGDLRRLRLEKYTPAAANEAKQWIESVIGETLPGKDLLEGLKDGVALCKLVNLAIGPPGVKFKKSAMPFVQMENISHFLRACQTPPLNLQQHDMFLTVDLYERKDPAQVLQCLGAFSRAANAANPDTFPNPIGPKAKNPALLSPQPTGYNTPPLIRGRGNSNASNASSSVYGRGTPSLSASRTGGDDGPWGRAKSPTNGATSPGVSSWSKKEHEGATSPAWNIAQYGYMGGANQNNLGIAFGGRRQITSAGPAVPSLYEKEKKRKEEAEKLRLQQEEEERKKKAELEAEEARAKKEEERRWEEEAKRIREEERRKIEEEKRRWEEEERQWKMTEEKRRKEEAEAERRLQEERAKARQQKSGSELRGQYLSQYQAGQESSDKERIRQLEEELAKAREREAQYERERQGRSRGHGNRDAKKARSRSRSRPAAADKVSRQDSWSVRDEQNFASKSWHHHQNEVDIEEEPPLSPPLPSQSPRPLPDPANVKTHRTGEKSSLPPPTLPIRKQPTGGQPLPIAKQHTGSRPLPDPTTYSATTSPESTRQLPTPGSAGSNNRSPFAKPISPRSSKQTTSPFSPKPTTTPFSTKPPTISPFTSKPTTHSPFVSKSPFAKPTPQPNSRTDRYLSSNPAPLHSPPTSTFVKELAGTVDEQAEEDRRRQQAQKQTKAAGWASKSLLEREMELERQRQKEWEESQKETAKAVRTADGVEGIGGGIGGRWDVGQWSGYTGGDGQNKGGQGIGANRRQIVGPRPLPGNGGR